MVKSVTFDLWNTIFGVIDYTDARIDFLIKFLEKEGFSKDKNLVRDAYLSALKTFINIWEKEQRYISAAERTELTLKGLGITLTSELKKVIAKEFEEIVLNDPPPLVEGAEMVLKSLHKHYRTGLICDSGMSPGRILRKVLESHNLLKYFNCTVFSDEMGCTKPNPIIFKKALKKLNAEPVEAIHIGDLLLTDIAGAKAVGMKAVWFNWKNELRRVGIDIQPDYEIHKLSELLHIVR